MKKEYKKNFISNFIIRFDFDKYSEIDVDEIASLFEKKYPINEKKNIQDHQIIIDQNESLNAKPRIEPTNLIHEITLLNGEQTERINISNLFFSYETVSYITFEKIKEKIFPILEYLDNNYQIKKYQRFGIRYINLITLPCRNKNELYNWSNYINDELLKAKNVFAENELLQTIQINNIKSKSNEDILYTIQTGIPNRNFPASLMEKTFLIDIDGCSKILMDKSDIVELFDVVHQEEKEIFEICIKDELRGVMNE